MLLINELIVTQDDIRNPGQIEGMITHLQNGGNWNNNPIHINEFEDGRRYIHDGHHRCWATLQVREYLDMGEYVITYFTYDDYLAINLEQGWVTPFDPRIHVRLCDIWTFKNEALSHANPQDFIEKNRPLYRKPRIITLVKELYVSKIPQENLRNEVRKSFWNSVSEWAKRVYLLCCKSQ